MADDFNSSVIAGNTTGATSNNIVFSAPYLTTGHAGCVFRVRDEAAGVYRYFVAQSLISSQVAKGYWEGAAPPLYARTALWEEQANGVYGGFRTVAVWQSRLVFGGVRDSGTSIWLSKAGNFRNFDLGTALDSDGIAHTASGGVKNILHLAPAVGALLIFTDNGIFASPLQDDRPLTPTNFRLNLISEYIASSAVLPTLFDGGVIFSQSISGAVRDVVPTGQNMISATPLSLAVPTILGLPIDLAVQNTIAGRPEQYAFFVNGAGNIALLHSIREQQVSSWVQWTTNGSYRAVCCVSGNVFAAVTRNGIMRLEVFDPAFAFDASVFGASISRVEHLQDFVVHYASGTSYYGAEAVLPYGVITVPEGVTEKLEVGLAFDWLIEPLPPIMEMPGQTLTNRTQRVVKTSLLLHKARSASVSGDVLVLRSDGFLMDADAARSGWWTARHLGWSRRDEPMLSSLRITRNVPLPCGVLSMIREIAA